MSYQPTFYDFHSIFFKVFGVYAHVCMRASQASLKSPAKKLKDIQKWLLYQIVAPMGGPS